MHLRAELIAASMTLEPLGEVGANFSLQLSSRIQFTKINNKKKLSPKINVKNIKNRFFFTTEPLCYYMYMYVDKS